MGKKVETQKVGVRGATVYRGPKRSRKNLTVLYRPTLEQLAKDRKAAALASLKEGLAR